MNIEAQFDVCRRRLWEVSGRFIALHSYAGGFWAFWQRRTEFWG